MCYPSPGPRCTKSAKASLATAKKRLDKAKGSEQIVKAEDAHFRAELEFYCTTGGLQYLGKKIKLTGDPDGQYASMMERAQQSRELRLSISKEMSGKESRSIHLPEEDYDDTDALSKAKYAQLEEDVAKVLTKGAIFRMNGDTYISMGSGKPKSATKGGEPKTDVYAVARNAEGEIVELKISCKKKNADFLENKVSKERFDAIVGDEDMQHVLHTAIDAFSDRPTFTAESGRHPVKDKKTGETLGYEDVYLLGYRLDILNKDGKNHIPWEAPHDSLMEIYAGNNLPDSKRNAIVPGLSDDKPIKNSGVANLLLVGDKFDDAQAVVDKAVPIEQYIEDNKTVYFVFKGVNYRSIAKKWDSNRPLGMSVDWKQGKDGNITGKLDANAKMFDNDANTIGNKPVGLINKEK